MSTKTLSNFSPKQAKIGCFFMEKNADESGIFLFQCHDDYSLAFDYHAQQNNAASATALTEAHNNYVQQLHAANGMVDQYYRDTLPQLLQVWIAFIILRRGM